MSNDGASGNDAEITITVISQEGLSFTSSYSETCLVEYVKSRAINNFFSAAMTVGRTFALVKVQNCMQLRDMLNLRQENVKNNAELLLVERQMGDAGELWDAASVRAPPPAVIAATTAATSSSIPPPPPPPQQPDLQALLGSDEITSDLRKVLISLIEAGARLATSGRRWEETLKLLSKALDKPPGTPIEVTQSQVITLETIAERLEGATAADPTSEETSSGTKSRRARQLNLFLEKFRLWCQSVAPRPTQEAIASVREMGFTEEMASEALTKTGCNEAAAVLWLVGERSESLKEVVKGLPQGQVLDAVLRQPQVQRILLNTRMLLAFISMLSEESNVSLWMRFDNGKMMLSQILKVYHSEKYCQAVNQFSPCKMDT